MAAAIRVVVADLAVGDVVHDSLPAALEWYVGEVGQEWLHGDSFDGFIIVGMWKRSEYGLELRGTAILIRDQTEIALWLTLRADPTRDRIAEGSCRLGIPDDDTGKLVRVPFGSSDAVRERALVFESAEEVSWMIEIDMEDGDVSGRRRTMRRCTVCQSLFFADSSVMTELCPECAHQLYDHARCDHEFRGDRCIVCFWDGTESEYVEPR